MLYFEDFAPGAVATHWPLTVTAEDIIAFAEEFDPQPFHVDARAAENTLLEGLAASGWHTCSLMMRLIAEGFLLSSASMGSPGIEEVKWLKPVRPNDRLTLTRTVVESRPSKSRPDMGLVKFAFVLTNQAGERVATMDNLIMFGRRPTAVIGAV